jgi:signal transduction histidine kinase
VIRWIQSHNWLSGVYFAIAGILIFGGADLMLQGVQALIISSLLSLSLLVARQIPQAAIGVIALGSVLEISLGLHPLAAGTSVAFTIAIISAFASQLWRLIAVGVATAAGLAVVIEQAYTLPFGDTVYGMGIFTEPGRITVAVFGSLLVLAVNTLAWLTGRLLMTRDTHVGTQFDRAVAAEEQARLNLEIAEQNERFDIARDINELIVQRISAVISQAEGGIYASKADASAPLRSLEELNALARRAHTELRRLYDMLNKTHKVSAAPPGIDELEQLVVTYRELGYNVTLRHEGPRFEMNDGAQLAIYRIVYEAMANVRDHAPVGSDLTVDFAWVQHGVQILVKDNGIEFANRAVSLDELTDTGYTVAEDLQALVKPIRGASLTAMRERAALYGGSIEATRVPGVGFTVSAIFPNLRELAG